MSSSSLHPSSNARTRARKNPRRAANSEKAINYYESSDEEDAGPDHKRRVTSIAKSNGGKHKQSKWMAGVRAIVSVSGLALGTSKRASQKQTEKPSKALTASKTGKGDDDEDFDVLGEYRETIHELLKEHASSLKIKSVEDNEHAKPGTPLYERFMKSWMSVEDSTVKLCFHGTPEQNILNICQKGLDPGKRLRQACGPGEYFAVNASTSLGYCCGGRKMLVVAVIMDRTGLTQNNDSIVVVHKPEHQLPLFVVTFDRK